MIILEPMAVPAVSAWGKTGIRYHTQPKIDKGSTSMSPMSSADQRSTLGLHSLEQYEPLIGAATAARILRKMDRISHGSVAHVSSTFHAGGVTEILTPPSLMMDAIGIELARCKEVAFENDAFTSILVISLVRKFAPA